MCTVTGATWSPVVAGAAGGFAGGFTNSALSGGNLRQDITGGLQGSVSGALFGAAGGVGEADSYARYAAHASAGCISSVASGGNCGQGATSAVFGKYTTNSISGFGDDGTGSVIARGVATSVAGGVGSVIAGGKFENGAMTAAYGYLFNELMHQTTKAQRGYGESAWDRDQAMERYRSGVGGTVRIDVDTLDFGGLTDSGWDAENRKTFTFRNTQDYGVHGTVTIQKMDADTFSVLPETYNNDHKQSLSVVHPRNVATAINRWLHGSGDPFRFEFDGARSFDKLGRGQ